MLHEEKITTIADKNFRNKVLEAAFTYAKGILLGTINSNNANVKRFAQIVLKEVAGNGAWLDGLAYFTLSSTTAITLTSTQAQVTTEVAIIFPYFAKAHYGDIS